MIVYEHIWALPEFGDVMIESFRTAMRESIDVLLRTTAEEVTILHHNDTDGLSSGAILKEAFSRVGYTTRRFALEKPYPEVLEKVLADEGRILVFADFAGRIAPLISELNDQRNLVIILDHHPAEKIEDPAIFVLDGELYGLKGDRDISASATCYLFSELLLSQRGLDVKDLAHLGALGAIGDGFFVDGALSSVNRSIITQAVEKGLARIEAGADGEIYHIRLAGIEYPALDICRILDTVGGVGYYEDGASVGIRICLEGIDQATSDLVRLLEEKQKRIFSEEIRDLSKNLRTTGHLQWLDVGDRFVPMGVKMIGVFLTQIKDSQSVDHSKYLAGFQHIPQEVPGFGSMGSDSTKISMRVSEELTQRIRNKEIPALNTFLPEATERLGGFTDACHGLSAATTVRIGQEARLIEEIERILEERMD